MKKVDIVQQRGKSSHSAAAWMKKSWWSSMEKKDIVEHNVKK